jgi:hypothetical protein
MAEMKVEQTALMMVVVMVDLKGKQSVVIKEQMMDKKLVEQKVHLRDDEMVVMLVDYLVDGMD